MRDYLPPEAALRDLGEHRLRGLEDSERVFQVVTAGLPADFPPLNTLESLSTSLPLRHTPFVGRVPELAMLRERLTAAGRGQGGVVLVAGEPGIGKTSLLLELAERARAGGWQVLFGRAYESEGMPPYLPFVEVLREYVRACSLSELRSQLGHGAADVALIVREVRTRLPDLPLGPPLSPEDARYRLFESVADFLRTMARAAGAGLLVVPDDLQWADKPTLLLLQHLARRLLGVPLLVTGTYRTVELDRTHPLAQVLAELHRERLEVVRHLLAEGRDLADPRASTADWGIPEGTREVIGRRLSHLGPETNRVLRVGAVLGDGFDLSMLEAASGSDADRLLDTLDGAIAAGILREERDGYSFAHALIRQTLYEELSLTRRVRMHRQVAVALEHLWHTNLEPRVDALAYHFCQGVTDGDARQAVDYARRAGDRAAALLAYEQASRYYEMALRALELQELADEALQHDLLLALATNQRKVEDFDRARMNLVRAAEIARKLGAHEQFARAISFSSWSFGMATFADERLIGLAEEALALLPAGDSPLRAEMLARLGFELTNSPARERGEALLQQGVAMAERTGDPGTLARILLVRLMGYWGPGSPEERLAIAAEVERLAELAGDKEVAQWAILHQTNYLVALGDLPAADRELDRWAASAEDLRLPQRHWELPARRAGRALLDGRLAEADELMRQALAGVRRVSPTVPANLLAQRFMLRREQGRLAGEEAATRAALALIYGELGRAEEARVEFERLAVGGDDGQLAVWSKRRVIRPLWLFTAVCLAEVCALLGDARRAAMLYEEFRPYEGWNSSLYTGAVDRYLGPLAATMGRWQDAEQHFEHALAFNARIGARLFLAHTQHAYGRMLLGTDGRPSGDLPRARELLHAALASYTDLGVEHQAAKVSALLSDLYARAPSSS